jgi:hypothetical protein
MPRVAQTQSRVAAVEVRCEPQARQLLESLRLSQHYHEVIRVLERTSGSVSCRDVEDAAIRMLARKRKTRSDSYYEWLGEWKPTPHASAKPHS